MNRIDTKLAELKTTGKKILSPYITAGDPTAEDTIAIMHALVASGADILEIGIPFSDPMAEGPVIQGAMERALAGGMTCEKVLAMVEAFRQKDTQTPIILMGYLNPLEQYGYKEFAAQAVKAGVDGTILVDMPPEESDIINTIWAQAGLYNIYLCSPTTSNERMTQISRNGKGYLYYVSLKGVTGSNAINLDDVERLYQQRKAQTHLPILVGFGIKSAEMAARVARFADGVVVGAALIEAIHEGYKQQQDYIAKGASLISELRQAMDQ